MRITVRRIDTQFPGRRKRLRLVDCHIADLGFHPIKSQIDNEVCDFVAFEGCDSTSWVQDEQRARPGHSRASPPENGPPAVTQG